MHVPLHFFDVFLGDIVMQKQKLLLTGDYPIIASPTLAKAYGLATATFLQKLHYCLQSSNTKTNMGKKYWYHTLADWVKTIGIYSVSTIKRSIALLKKEGIIIVKKLSASQWVQTNSYAINYQKLEELFSPQVAEPQQIKIAKPTPPNPIFSMPEKDMAGTDKPTIAPATDADLKALPKDIKGFYQHLRQLKVDISHQNPCLPQWSKNKDQVLKQIAYKKQSGINQYQWHTPEQLLKGF